MPLVELKKIKKGNYLFCAAYNPPRMYRFPLVRTDKEIQQAVICLTVNLSILKAFCVIK